MHGIKNMTRPFTNRYLIGVYCGVVVILSLIWWRFTNIENMLGNHGLIHTSLDVILSWVTIFTLPLL